MNFEMPSQESAEDKAWEVYVAELKDYLRQRATSPGLDMKTVEERDDVFEEESAAAKALEEVEQGDFEAASNFLDSEIKILESGIVSAENSLAIDSLAPQHIAQFQKQLEVVQKLKDGLERREA